MREHKTGTWLDSRLSPTEYITKAAAQDAWGNIRLTCEEFEQLDDAIDSIPPADVEPVRRGTWEWKDAEYGYECSACHCFFDYTRTFEIFDHGYEYASYCPNCGAKMEDKNA